MSIRTQRSSTRFGAAAIVAVLFASLFAFIAPAGALSAGDPVVRYDGANRYDTAAKAALDNFTAGANSNIILASGENFPDGLAAAYLAGAVNGPLLLTATDSLPASTANALGVLEAANTTVHVVGGDHAVSANVKAQLAALGYTVNEISGPTRYDTSAAIAAEANTIAGVGSFQGARTAIVTTGENFPDALSAGPLSYAGSHPILLTTTATLSPQTDAALTSLNIQRVILLGGTAAVSPAVEAAITAKGIAVTRVSGPNRYSTATALADVLVATPVEGGAGWGPAIQPVLALGTNFPDALSASQVGGIHMAPIVLTGTDSLPEASENFLISQASNINGLFVMGGTAAISATTLTAARNAATPVQVTATIAAEEGRTSFTVVFSEGVNPATVQSADFTFASVGRTITAGAVTAVAGTGSTTFSVAITPSAAPAGFKTGDVVNLLASSVTSLTGRANASATTTVAEDTTRPTAVLLRAFDAHDEVWVAFSETVTVGNITVGGQTVALNPMGGTLYRGILAPDAVAGQAITIAAGSVTDLAGNTNLVINGNVVTDNNPPSLLSATYSATPVAQAGVTLTGGGTGGAVDIDAKSTGVAAGLAGNSWDVVAGNPAGSLSVTVNTTLRQIGINGNLTGVDANALAVALNSNATFAANFTAAVATGGTLDIATPQDLTGGASSITVRAQFSESLDPTSSAIDDTDIIGAVAGGTSIPNGAILGVLAYNYTATSAAQVPTGVNLGGGEAEDLGGNANLPQATVTVTKS